MQVHDFTLEETAHALWALAKLDFEEASVTPLLVLVRDTWPRLLRTAVAERGLLPSAAAQKAGSSASSAHVQPRGQRGRATQSRAQQPAPRVSTDQAGKHAAAASADGNGPSQSRGGRSRLSSKIIAQIAYAYARARTRLPTEPDPGVGFDPAFDDDLLTFVGALPDFSACAHMLDPQGMAVLLWAFAKLGAAPQAIDELAWLMYPHVCKRLQGFSPMGLTFMIYALALARVRHDALLGVLTGQCMARMRSFSRTVRSLVCWPVS